ncbi:MAG TPA: kelch repeat-containing protein [Gemmatimonadaceae bacterium]|nr:kelch repeat-containing protein [Gemmatimonadaceae bacterium]
MSSISLLRSGGFVVSLLACGNHTREASGPSSDTTVGVDSASTPTISPLSVRQVTTLRTARAAHTATTLKSGQILVVGGMGNGGSSLASAELYHPQNNLVEEIGSLAEPRVSHTATPLSDGRVLIAGGYNGDYLRSLEILDPSTKRFSRAGSLIEGRSGHTATVLSDGRVLFAGGVSSGWTFLKSAEIYDPRTDRSEPVGSMSVSREGHTATLLADGRVLIVGGHSGRRPNVQVYEAAELFNPLTRKFETTGALGTARHKHDAIKLTDDRVLVIGGADRSDRVHFSFTEIYHPKSAAFSPGPSMANKRYKIAGTSVLLPGGDVLVTSGAEVAEVLEIRQWRFRTVRGRLPAAYRFSAAAASIEGDVFITGGYSDENENTGGVWRFTKIEAHGR